MTSPSFLPAAHFLSSLKLVGQAADHYDHLGELQVVYEISEAMDNAVTFCPHKLGGSSHFSSREEQLFELAN